MCIPGAESTCLFGDMTDVWSDAIRGTMKTSSRTSPCPTKHEYLDIMRDVRSVGSTGWCFRHCRYCVFKRARIHVGGPPCVDFSPQGSRKKSAGKTRLAFVSWVAHRRKLMEPI
eukprot:9035959-Pyramimonas_sp.AAC.1